MDGQIDEITLQGVEREYLFRIIDWIDRSGMMTRNYHLGDDNCQHFAQLLWSQLSTKAYPNRGKFGEDIMQMTALNDPHVNGKNPSSPGKRG